MKPEPIDISYFPGCSLATSAKENNLSLANFCKYIGINLIELDDWNCCGSSSAHSINSELAFYLATRNLALSPSDKPLLIACPSCLLRLRHAHLYLKEDQKARIKYEKMWNRPVNTELHILHFFELLESIPLPDYMKAHSERLAGLSFVPYYGCMLARPPEMRYEKNYYGTMERILSLPGATPLQWAYSSRCCGTFLSVVRPDVVTKMVNKIILGAMNVGADCIVTACAMCHLNLEIRCSLKEQIPIFHFSEMLSLALGADEYKDWFSRHLIDPRPILKSKGIIR